MLRVRAQYGSLAILPLFKCIADLLPGRTEIGRGRTRYRCIQILPMPQLEPLTNSNNEVFDEKK